MEEMNINEGDFKPANRSSIQNPTGPRSYKRGFYVVVILSLGLLAGIITLALYYKNSLQDSDKYLSSSNQLSSMTEERDLLKASLTEMTKELERLQRLVKEKTCPAGWRKFSHSCYLLSESSDSWHSARKHCIDQGADLVVIGSSEEQNFIASFTQKETWIGLNDIEQEGTWKWVDGTPLTLQYWASGQPDNRWPRQEDCAHIRYTGTSWNDERCEEYFPWVCEKVL